jgi:amino-acid N-acetyltransferase
MLTPYLRAATASDQPSIQRLVRAARLNPFGLHWPRFVVAEVDGQIVGAGQIKILGDGTRELASIAVVPAWQGRGVGSAIVHTLVSTADAPLYLRCAAHNEGYYRRLGFRTLAPAEMPPNMRREARVVNAVASLVNRLTGGDTRMVIMGQ